MYDTITIDRNGGQQLIWIEHYNFRKSQLLNQA